jgi:hypothetical protein
MKHKKLRYVWSKRERDFMIHYPTRSWDGGLLHSFFSCDATDYLNENGQKYIKNLIGKHFLEELDKRGFDLTTLKFEISLKETK